MESVCDAPVVEAIDGGHLQRGLVHLLPNDREAVIDGTQVRLAPRAKAPDSDAALVDGLFGALAMQPAPHGIGVALSSPTAGQTGMSALRKSGGLVFVCDPRRHARDFDESDAGTIYRAHSPASIAIELGELFREPYTHEVMRHAAMSKRTRGEPAILEHKRVLVVGRNANAHGSMEATLESWGHQVVTASNTLEAVELAEVLGPEVSFIDISDAGFPGHDICYSLRRRHPDAKNLLVGLVNTEEPEKQCAAFSAGFHALLSNRHDEQELRWLAAAQPGRVTPAGWLFP
jgi:CheY-like chemotaxis protein